jgi:hypothetical protein
MATGRIPINGTAAIQSTIVDAKGDIIAATGADAVSRLAVGANDTVLTADSSTATGLKWAAAGGAADNFTLLNTGGTNLSSATTTVSGISGKDKLLIILDGASGNTASDVFYVQFNTGSTYQLNGAYLANTASYSADLLYNLDTPEIYLGGMSNNVASIVDGYVMAFGCNGSGYKAYLSGGAGDPAGGSGQTMRIGGGTWSGSSAVTSISVKSLLGNFDAGKVYVYGA